MSTAIRLLSVALVVLVATGCSNRMVAKTRYENDIQTLQDYVAALEKRNQELEAEVSGLRVVAGDAKLVAMENEFYDQIARNIEKWLTDSKIDRGDAWFDKKTGKWIIAGDVLFDSGSFRISKTGAEILRKIATSYTTKNNGFKIVGHTDRDPIKKAKTKKALNFDNNLELSALRAIAVAGVLQKTGITRNRLFIEGRGNTQPVAPNNNVAANKKKNRRVEIFILDSVTGK